MALIKTISEIKAVLPKLVSNLNSSDQLPNFDAAEMKYLVPLIGMAQYNDLQTKYDGNTLSVIETALLKNAQFLVTVNAFRDEMIINQVMWTDQGLRTVTTADMGKPVGWEFKKLEDFFIGRSADAEEVLLTYLWSAKASFPLWTASQEYVRFTSLFIRTGADFKQQYATLHQPMRTYYALQPVLAEVQEKYLEEAIGRELTAYLVAVATPTQGESFCIKLLKKAVAYFGIKEACLKLPVRLSDAGFTVASMMSDRDSVDAAGRESASAALIEGVKNNCEEEGQNFLSKARYELYKLRQSGLSPSGFNTAYDAGTLTGYVPPGSRTRGNEDRHFFVL